MKLLLDTATFLWATLKPKELSAHAKHLLLDLENERYLSAVSSLEIAIQYSLGKIVLPKDPEQFVPEHREKLAAQELCLDEGSALHVTRLPHLHNDPFDRVLICQAIFHGMVLLTPDTIISKYAVRTAW